MKDKNKQEVDNNHPDYEQEKELNNTHKTIPNPSPKADGYDLEQFLCQSNIPATNLFIELM